jgi:hypothetical protein
MGYIGTVDMFGLGALRVTSCSLNSRQAIEHPDVIDGTVDWTLYQLKGIESEGDIALPVMTGGAGSLANLFDLATNRDADGELINAGNVTVTYGHAAGRRFSGCKINTLEFRATAGERMDATIGVWGTTAEYIGGLGPAVAGPPKRVLAWADIALSVLGGSNCDIREFSISLNNNLSRNYTFCPAAGYFPSNISTGKRNISGSIGFQGFAPTDVAQADQNRTKTEPDTSIVVNVSGGGFTKTFLNVIYEYQTIEAQPGLITSTVNWYAHADGGGIAFS